MPRAINPSNPNFQPTQSVSQPQPHPHALEFIILSVIVIALIVVAVIAYFIFAHASHTGRYAGLAAVLSSGKKVTLLTVTNTLNVSTDLQNLSKISQSKATVNSTPTNFSYSGSGDISIAYSIVRVSVPFTYTAMLVRADENYSSTHIYLNMSNYNFSQTYVTTPTISYICSNQNSSASDALGLFGVSSASQKKVSPDNKCLAVAKTVTSYQSLLNNSGTLTPSTLKTLNETIQQLLNNIYINATSVSYSNYQGNSCINITGYTSSNRINLLKYFVNNSQYNSNYPNSTYILPQPTNQYLNVTIGGPYSMCISPTSGTIYEMNYTQHMTASYNDGYSTTGPTNFTFTLSATAFRTSSYAIPTPSELATLPYPVINGTCTGQPTLTPTSGYSFLGPAYYNCQSVNMNTSGYLSLNLAPSTSSLSSSIYGPAYGNTTTPSQIHLLGIACIPSDSSPYAIQYQNQYNTNPYIYNLTNATGQYGPAASYYEPLNIITYSNSPMGLVVKCASVNTSRNGAYSGELYSVTVQNYSGTFENVEGYMGSFEVLPTLSGTVGANQNTGTVYPVVLSNLTNQYNNYNYTNNSTQYNYTNNSINRNDTFSYGSNLNLTCAPSSPYSCSNASFGTINYYGTTYLDNLSLTLRLSYSAQAEYNISTECTNNNLYNKSNLTETFSDLAPGSSISVQDYNCYFAAPNTINSTELWVAYSTTPEGIPTSYNVAAKFHN